MAMEKWKAIPGYRGVYLVSDHGNVKRVKARKKHPVKDGALSPYRGGRYPIIILHKGNRGLMKCFTVHNLVCKSFIGPRPKGKEVNHIDGDKNNNRLSNLEYISRAENIRHAVNMNLFPKGSKSPVSKLTEKAVLMIRFMYSKGSVTQADIGRLFKVSSDNVSLIVNRRTWKHVN